MPSTSQVRFLLLLVHISSFGAGSADGQKLFTGPFVRLYLPSSDRPSAEGENNESGRTDADDWLVIQEKLIKAPKRNQPPSGTGGRGSEDTNRKETLGCSIEVDRIISTLKGVSFG